MLGFRPLAAGPLASGPIGAILAELVPGGSSHYHPADQPKRKPIRPVWDRPPKAASASSLYPGIRPLPMPPVSMFAMPQAPIYPQPYRPDITQVERASQQMRDAQDIGDIDDVSDIISLLQ